MCGIVGFVGDSEEPKEVLSKMMNSVAHRGPDSNAQWIDSEHRINLGHQRLSIIELSKLGQQPMLSQCGRYVLIYNGEIYNFQELAVEIERLGTVLRGGSDTEVLLEAVSLWGIEKALSKCSGMFAAAIWDKKEKKLSLFRDRLGIKPLYYGWQGELFIFASEPVAFCQHPKFSREIDRSALAMYFQRNCIPAPYSIYRGIYKLLPGTILTLAISDIYQKPADFSPLDENSNYISTYWSLHEVIKNRQTSTLTATDAVEQLDQLLKKTVTNHMIADVSLGALLSGGIDSSLVVALMQQKSSNPVKSFSIGFSDPSYDESLFAKQIAQHLGTQHTECMISPKEMIDSVAKIPQIYSEPFADSSQIPTALVYSIAKRDLNVVLSGDGGDELFYGYSRYAQLRRLWSLLRLMPKQLRAPLGKIILNIPTNSIDYLARILPTDVNHFGRRLHTLARVFDSEDFISFYNRSMSHWLEPSKLVIGAEELPKIELGVAGLDERELMMYLDALSYLPDDILVKVDRASMAASVEARVPLLDHEVAEFAWSLPLNLRAHPADSKWILKQVLARYVPEKLFDRPKRGFNVPLGDWMRKELRDWADSLLSSDKHGYLEQSKIDKLWNQHLTGKHDWSAMLWNVVVFRAWMEDSKSR